MDIKKTLSEFTDKEIDNFAKEYELIYVEHDEYDIPYTSIDTFEVRRFFRDAVEWVIEAAEQNEPKSSNS